MQTPCSPAGTQSTFLFESSEPPILSDKRVLIKAKFDVLLTLFPSKMGGVKKNVFLARAPTRGHPYFGSLLEPSGINRKEPIKTIGPSETEWGALLISFRG